MTRNIGPEFVFAAADRLTVLGGRKAVNALQNLIAEVK